MYLFLAAACPGLSWAGDGTECSMYDLGEAITKPKVSDEAKPFFSGVSGGQLWLSLLCCHRTEAAFPAKE